MDEREQQPKIRHRAAVFRHAEEVSGNVAATCRYYGISRPNFYKWLHQYAPAPVRAWRRPAAEMFHLRAAVLVARGLAFVAGMPQLGFAVFVVVVLTTACPPSCRRRGPSTAPSASRVEMGVRSSWLVEAVWPHG
ncbi:MAG TPA: hypothetical protein VFH30_06110 [Acidimicrobiales bacterium]|nr:hypothetical protein [Acidimicrobiales bacterium]